MKMLNNDLVLDSVRDSVENLVEDLVWNSTEEKIHEDA